MKNCPLLSLAVLLIGASLSVAPAAERELELKKEDDPQTRWRVGVSLSVGFNVSANFSRLAPSLPPPPPRSYTLLDPNLKPNYDDGYGLADGSMSGSTTYWGYFDLAGNQNINAAGDRLTLHKTSFDQPVTSTGVDSDPLPGFEVSLSRDLGKLGCGRWGLEGSFGFTTLNIQDNRTITVAGTLTSDQYDLTGSALGYFQGSFPNNYQGPPGLAFNVPFIPTTTVPGTSTEELVALSVNGNREFDANVYFWRLGAYWEMPLTTNLSLIVDGGLVLAWIHSDFSFDQITILQYGDPVVESGSSSKTGWQTGGYVGLSLRYAISERWSALVGGRYEGVGDYHQETGGKQAELQFGKSVFLTVGVAYSF